MYGAFNKPGKTLVSVMCTFVPVLVVKNLIALHLMEKKVLMLYAISVALDLIVQSQSHHDVHCLLN